ncbi:MAG: hypothetical protein RL026_433 [Pseudomonadota bacterium]|jgi:predicted Zn-dependent protease
MRAARPLPDRLPAVLAAVLLGVFASARVTAQQADATPPRLERTGLERTVISLPDLGSGANALISRNEEQQVGRMILRDLRDQRQVLEDPESTEYIHELGLRLAAQAQEGEQQFTFFVVRDRGVNAFAVPGGVIGINAGLVLETANESELAGVMAHEIGHVVQRHIARAIEAQSRNSLPMMAAMLGAILVGVAAGGDAAPGMIAMAQGAAMQQQINFTRMEEHEADRVGIGYLSAAGFDPDGMAGFFSTMGRLQGPLANDIPYMLKTHPVSALRVAEARARAAQLPPVENRPDSPGYGMIRERLRVLMAPEEQDLRPYYEAQLQQPGAAELPLRYGFALAAMRAGDAATAATALEALVDAYPETTLLHSALGEALLADRRPEQALARFAKAVELFPRNVPLSVRYADALLAAGQASRAHELLLDLFNNAPPTPEQIRLTARVADAAGDRGDAYYYMAEYHISGGDLMIATQQLDLALAQDRLTSVQRKRYLARREEIRGVLREERMRRYQGG